MKPTSMHQVPRINPIISGIDHELVRRWVTLALALSSLCPIFTFFGLFCFCFSLFFLFPILTLILLLKLLFDHNPSRLIDVRSAILGTKFNRLTELQGLISTIASTDIDQENDNNNNNNNNAKLVLQLGHDLEEKQENFDLDSVELPVFYETDDDDEKPVQRSTVEEREQARQIQPPETGKREEFRESWFNDVMTFWKRMETGEPAKAFGIGETHSRISQFCIAAR